MFLLEKQTKNFFFPNPSKNLRYKILRNFYYLFNQKLKKIKFHSKNQIYVKIVEGCIFRLQVVINEQFY